MDPLLPLLVPAAPPPLALLLLMRIGRWRRWRRKQGRASRPTVGAARVGTARLPPSRWEVVRRLRCPEMEDRHAASSRWPPPWPRPSSGRRCTRRRRARSQIRSSASPQHLLRPAHHHPRRAARLRRHRPQPRRSGRFPLPDLAFLHLNSNRFYEVGALWRGWAWSRVAPAAVGEAGGRAEGGACRRWWGRLGKAPRRRRGGRRRAGLRWGRETHEKRDKVQRG